MNLKTGFEKLDNIINSLKNGELICIASRPGVGKTTLSIDIVNNVSKQTKNKIIFISLESSKEKLKERFINDNVEIIDDKRSIVDIEEVCRKLYLINHSLSLIVIDYLQLVIPEIWRMDKTREPVDILKSLKQLALELNVPIIITSQLPRTIIEREDKRPILTDLENCGTSYHYHKVLFLYKDIDNNLKIEVAKNQGVSHRIVDLSFNKENLSFEEK